ncbi:MAG: choline-responsive transcriptional repressor BetI [Pikeienuella sp.]
MARRRIRDIRHDELIRATIQVIHQRGYAASTVQEIASAAGASAASINYYFGSKERLLEATMRRLLNILRVAMLERYAIARTARQRLDAVVDANFDDRFFTPAQCGVWMQFWSFAPQSPRLARLHRINRARVRSQFAAALRPLLPEAERETARAALQAYMDGVWLEACQQETPPDPAEARRDAAEVVALLLGERRSPLQSR